MRWPIGRTGFRRRVRRINCAPTSAP